MFANFAIYASSVADVIASHGVEVQYHQYADAPRSATSTVSSVTVADVNLPLANEMKVFGVIQDRHLTFEKHVSAVARSCN